MKYDLKSIMTRAWSLFRKYAISFAEALHRAWQAAKLAPINAARITKAAISAGAPLDCLTWHGWREAGYQVRHGEKALFSVDLHWPTKGDGAIYKASFFSAAQVEPLTA